MSKINSVFSGPVSFIMGVSSPDNFPETVFPEFAFMGRSNVGKSSLINAILQRNKIAHVSNTPGRTREVNLFNVSDTFILADLPGYGYAAVSKTVKAAWNNLIKSYMLGRKPLKRVFLLIDSRHGYKDLDKEIMSAMDKSAVSYQIVLTKTDKAENLDEVMDAIKAANEKFIAVHPEILQTSVRDKIGIESVQNAILDVVKYV